jgi:hypothetical protein
MLVSAGLDQHQVLAVAGLMAAIPHSESFLPAAAAKRAEGLI